MISRSLANVVRKQLQPTSKRKVIAIMGARQVGKTTLMRDLFAELPGRKEFLNGDFADDRALLVPERAPLTRLAAHLDYLFIDEAQNLTEPGRTLKLLHDEFPALRIVASGSFAFDLRRSMGEPLTGRQVTLEMFPLSLAELQPAITTAPTLMESAMIHGSYPEVILARSPEEKERYLRQLAADYLLKDIFAQVEVNRVRLSDLLRVVALQIGQEVSLNELGTSLNLDVKTVSRYLGLLEDAFVLMRLGGFSRNLRKEVAKSRKIYFLDLGVRNALLNAFNPLSLRDDVGRLWENYLVIERRKRNASLPVTANPYFWRTYDRQEIDYIEETSGENLAAFEFKWGTKGSQRVKVPAAWAAAYPESGFHVITPANAAEFLRVSGS